MLIDNYVDDRILKVLTKRGEDVSEIIYTDPRYSHIIDDLIQLPINSSWLVHIGYIFLM